MGNMDSKLAIAQYFDKLSCTTLHKYMKGLAKYCDEFDKGADDELKNTSALIADYHNEGKAFQHKVEIELHIIFNEHARQHHLCNL